MGRGNGEKETWRRRMSAKGMGKGGRAYDKESIKKGK